jgi:lipoprotein NlpI
VRVVAAVSVVWCGIAGAVLAQDGAADAWRAKLRQAEQAYQLQQFDRAGELALEADQPSREDGQAQQRLAQILFLSGKVEESLPLFERANALLPQLAPHNWQRGVALGCAGKWEAGAAQFKLHHDVNPDDVENSAWYFLCLAKSKGREAAEAAIIPSRGDARPPMMDVLKMLKGTIGPEEVLTAAEASTTEGRARKQAKFYGFLYVGLYYDSIGEGAKAVEALDRCLAEAEGDYMGRTALHYRTLRFPEKNDRPTGEANGSK